MRLVWGYIILYNIYNININMAAKISWGIKGELNTDFINSANTPNQDKDRLLTGNKGNKYKNEEQISKNIILKRDILLIRFGNFLKAIIPIIIIIGNTASIYLPTGLPNIQLKFVPACKPALWFEAIIKVIKMLKPEIINK